MDVELDIIVSDERRRLGDYRLGDFVAGLDIAALNHNRTSKTRAMPRMCL